MTYLANEFPIKKKKGKIKRGKLKKLASKILEEKEKGSSFLT